MKHWSNVEKQTNDNEYCSTKMIPGKVHNATQKNTCTYMRGIWVVSIRQILEHDEIKRAFGGYFLDVSPGGKGVHERMEAVVVPTARGGEGGTLLAPLVYIGYSICFFYEG